MSLTSWSTVRRAVVALFVSSGLLIGSAASAEAMHQTPKGGSCCQGGPGLKKPPKW